jgi:hypothetical protein
VTRHRARLGLVAIGLLACAATLPAWSTPNASATGTVQQLFQYAPNMPGVWIGEEVFFSLSTQPSTACISSGFFAITSATVNDAQTRKNFFAMLLLAKSTGASIQVTYDSTGAYCDQNAIGVYLINLVP